MRQHSSGRSGMSALVVAAAVATLLATPGCVSPKPTPAAVVEGPVVTLVHAEVHTMALEWSKPADTFGVLCPLYPVFTPGLGSYERDDNASALLWDVNVTFVWPESEQIHVEIQAHDPDYKPGGNRSVRAGEEVDLGRGHAPRSLYSEDVAGGLHLDLHHLQVDPWERRVAFQFTPLDARSCAAEIELTGRFTTYRPDPDDPGTPMQP
jgi:hypothetical protein